MTTPDPDQPAAQPAPEPDEATMEAARKKTQGLEERYAPGARESVVLPGSDGTISGTAINDWIDEDGNVKEPTEPTQE